MGSRGRIFKDGFSGKAFDSHRNSWGASPGCGRAAGGFARMRAGGRAARGFARMEILPDWFNLAKIGPDWKWQSFEARFASLTSIWNLLSNLASSPIWQSSAVSNSFSKPRPCLCANGRLDLCQLGLWQIGSGLKSNARLAPHPGWSQINRD